MPSRIIARAAGAALLLFIVILGCPTQAKAREITDMVGRQVTIPDTIVKVYAASPPETMLVYAIDPTLLAGRNRPISKKCRRYVHPYMATIPEVGGYFGQGKTPNLEKLIEIRPDVVIGRKSNARNDKLEAFLAEFKIPLTYIVIDELRQYPEAFLVAGKILGRPERAKVLSEYTAKTLSRVVTKTSAMPEAEKVRVYYAEGPDGLSTENSTSIHAELINLAGGHNVHRHGKAGRYGNEKITLEKVMTYQPEVIFVDQPGFYKRIFSAPGWKTLPAVKNKRVYLTPKCPYNWFDRPPSFMRVLGLKWVADTLYPGLFDWDLREETREFFSIFLQQEITTGEAEQLLGASK
ncbi:ABC transporter substrate-binding protein [Pseudodesulfovibrio cashew]|nr:ABC transporter substrate-binding protein [Pseudodesulfovibrio cashew]